MNARARNWSPPVTVCKGKYSREEFGDSLPIGSTFNMIPKG
jgi:hypothetical protein